MNDLKIRIGVIGAGYWGPNLIRNCAQLGVLDSVCDVNPAALDSVKTLYPSLTTLTSVAKLLARPIDAVVIATPAQLHAEMALDAIAAGKHVFVEKPLALTVEDGARVCVAAKAANLQLFVGHLLLYHPAVIKMRAMIAENAIGDIWHVRSRRLGLGKLRAYESVWWSFAVHDVALLLALMGDDPEHASAVQISRRVPEICDFAYADFTFPMNRSAHIEVGWLDPQKSARIDVFGTTGVLTLEDSRDGGTLKLTECGPSDAEGRQLTVWRKDSVRVPFEGDEPLKAELLAFVRGLGNGEVRSAQDFDPHLAVGVLKALSMADAAARRVSFRSGVLSAT